MQKKHKAKQGVQKREKPKIQRKLITKKRAKEHRDRIARCPQALDQSKREPQNEASNWPSNLSLSSKENTKISYGRSKRNWELRDG